MIYDKAAHQCNDRSTKLSSLNQVKCSMRANGLRLEKQQPAAAAVWGCDRQVKSINTNFVCN